MRVLVGGDAIERKAVLNEKSCFHCLPDTFCRRAVDDSTGIVDQCSTYSATRTFVLDLTRSPTLPPTIKNATYEVQPFK
jgi:hypothetical protein